jgi:hypothetical protein
MAAKSKTKMPRPDAVLKRLPESVQETMWFLRFPHLPGSPDPDRQPLTQSGVRAWLAEQLRVDCSSGSFSEWENWYKLNLEMAAAENDALQAQAKLAKDPSFSPDQLARVGQVIFTSQALKAGNSRDFVALEKIRLLGEAQATDREKFLAATKTKMDAGLDALAEEIKGNEKARKLWAELKDLVKKA